MGRGLRGGAPLSGGEVLHRGEGWALRLATRDDDAALCALLRGVPLEGAVTVAQERDPGFFRLEDLHRPGFLETFVAEADDGTPVGCGTLVVRDAWMPDGGRGRVGYVCDLRVLPAWRGARVLPAMGRVALERARDAHGVHLAQAALMEGNRRVVGTARSTRPERAGQPRARVMTPYDMVSVPCMGQRLRAPREVGTATEADLDEVAAFLARGQRERAFGYVVDRRLLETRLARWPGLSAASFLLVRDATGRLVGCAAPWDASPVRRTRVLAYSPSMRTFRAVHGGLASLRGAAPLPKPGETFRYAYLTHVEVEDDDPVVLESLVAAAHARMREGGWHFLAVMAPRASPLQRAFRGPWAHRTRLCLHALTLEGGPFSEVDVSTARPGFEMALA